MSATFSAVVVARNEEALIRRCLESIAWCDERIVIFEVEAKVWEARFYRSRWDADVRRKGDAS